MTETQKHPFNEPLSSELKDLVARLAEAEMALETLISGQADAVIDPVTGCPILLREAQMALRASEAYFRGLAYHDTLTGLPNRLLFSVSLDHAVERAKRRAGRFALLFLDLDEFKVINDALGHVYGDQLLQVVADRLKRCVRAVDMVARLSGDEFTVILDEVAYPYDAAVLAKKIIDAVSEPILLGGKEVIASTSIGISVFPDDAEDSEGLVRAADAAMYRAKEAGRHTYAFYTAELTLKASERLSLEKSLSQALDRNEFVLYYQPQISLKSGKMVGVEALIRWQHPELGLVLPERFLRVSEEAGLIKTIGEWVLRSACNQAKVWQSQGLSLSRVAANLSEHQIVRDHVLDKVREMLEHSDCPKGVRLELEVTENVLQALVQNADRLQSLRALGTTIAVDGFGARHVCLRDLKRVPIDRIKIHPSFVHGISHNPNDKAIIKVIIAIGHGLEMNIIAEGVETKEQLRFLRDYGCDEAQGYFFSEPVPAEKIPHLLEHGN